jgi:heterodisulfide reductase subunit C
MVAITAEPRISFREEVENLLHAEEGVSLVRCVQCATCSAACPAVEFMDHTPRELIALINAGMRDEVMRSNTHWTCASCYACSEKCPEGIRPADVMYALTRYSLWKDTFDRDWVAPDFSRRFARTILRTGKSYEPGYAPAFMFEGGVPGAMREMRMAMRLLAKGRLPLIPARIKRIKNLRAMVARVLPLEGLE